MISITLDNAVLDKPYVDGHNLVILRSVAWFDVVRCRVVLRSVAQCSWNMMRRMEWSCRVSGLRAARAGIEDNQ
jgi:hypothetical protein